MLQRSQHSNEPFTRLASFPFVARTDERESSFRDQEVVQERERCAKKGNQGLNDAEEIKERKFVDEGEERAERKRWNALDLALSLDLFAVWFVGLRVSSFWFSSGGGGCRC